MTNLRIFFYTKLTPLLTHESGRGAESLYFGEVNKSVLTSYASVSEHRINQVPTFEVQRSSLT